MAEPVELSEQYVPRVEVLTHLPPQDIEDFERLLPQVSSKQRTRNEVALGLVRALNSPTTRIFVIRDEHGRIQATATGNKCPIPTGNKAWVDDVVVDQSYRKRGYGEMVTAAIEEWLLDDGITSVNLTSRPSRSDAGNLYERMGYVERDTRVYRHELGSLAVNS